MPEAEGGNEGAPGGGRGRCEVGPCSSSLRFDSELDTDGDRDPDAEAAGDRGTER